MNRTRTLLVFTAAITMGCSALIGTRDVFLDENAANGNEDGGGSSSGTGGSSGTASSSGSSGNVDGGGDATVDCTNINPDFQTSKDHCGRCGHSCGGGDCAGGKCSAIQISTVASAPLVYIVASADYIFVSTLITLTTQAGGVWRIPKNGGQAELYANLRYAGNMRVVNDKLFFVVEDDPGDGGTGQTGGLYYCPLAGNAPCNPSRVIAADNPRTITLDGTDIVFQDTAIGMRKFDTVGGGTTTINDFTAGRYLYFDSKAAFYNVTIFNSQPYNARMIEVFPDAGYEIRHDYTKNNANAGSLVGTTDAIYVAAFDYSGTTGGEVFRYPRVQGGLPCAYGGSTNKRPYGITIDATRIWWTNMGEGAAEPYTNGSIATCELAGCCATPETLWTGDGMPGGITSDSAFVYWVNELSGQVWKIAKP